MIILLIFLLFGQGDLGSTLPESDPVYYLIEGKKALKESQFEQALNCFRKGRSMFFEQTHSYSDLLIEESLLEEAKALIGLGLKKGGVRGSSSFDSAEKILRRLEKDHPNLEVFLELAKLLANRNRSSEAFLLIESALTNASFPYERGRLWKLKGDLSTPSSDGQRDCYERALFEFHEARWEGEEAFVVRLCLAKQAIKDGNTSGAMKLLAEITSSPLVSRVQDEALSVRGDLFREMGRGDLADLHLRSLELRKVME